MFRSFGLRMCSVALRHPDKIFTTILPPPPPWPAPTTSLSPSPTCRTSLQWKDAGLDDKTLTGALSHLQYSLRSVYKRKIYWPVEEFSSSNPTPREYFMMLLRPIPDIFNQLHSAQYLKAPVKCMSVDLGHSICGATFTAEGFELWNSTAPIILSLSDNLFDSSGQVSSPVKYALSLALGHTPSATIIVTNFKDIAIFFPPTENRPEPTFKRISTTQPPLALRVLTTAYLLNAALGGTFIDVPDPDLEFDEDILPRGPPQDPHRPLLRDEEVFATHHRNSDFDMATLVRDRARAFQFFRWRKHVSKTISKLVARPGDALTAKTNEVGQFVPDIRPIYSFDPSEIPSDTAAHLKAIQRESLLVTAGVAESFKQSKTFTLEIQDVVAEGSERGICTVYRCQITSIDNFPIFVSPLCLKLFDDRFQPLQSPDEDIELNDDTLPQWFVPVVYAEKYALNEAFAYDKLLPVQGSVIPWFYGTHRFTLPDGTILYGLLMEYVEGWKLDSNFARGLTADRQIKMIESCRHAARVLDVADVSQRDWHSEQALLYANPITKLDHAVLIDFALTTQTWEPHELNFLSNYVGLLRTLLGREGDVALDPELVWRHYGEPDDWDPVDARIPTEPRGNCVRDVKARDMFPWISSP